MFSKNSEFFVFWLPNMFFCFYFFIFLFCYWAHKIVFIDIFQIGPKVSEFFASSFHIIVLYKNPCKFLFIFNVLSYSIWNGKCKYCFCIIFIGKTNVVTLYLVETSAKVQISDTFSLLDNFFFVNCIWSKYC